MTRIGQTNEEQLVSRLKKLLQNVRDIKKAQTVGGSSLILQRTETENTWDVNATVLGSSADATWRVTWSPDIDSPTYSQLEYKYEVSNSNGNVIAYDDPNDIDSDTQKSYIVGLIPNPNLTDETVKLKFAIRSTSTGSLSWTRLT